VNGGELRNPLFWSGDWGIMTLSIITCITMNRDAFGFFVKFLPSRTWMFFTFFFFHGRPSSGLCTVQYRKDGRRKDSFGSQFLTRKLRPCCEIARPYDTIEPTREDGEKARGA